MENNIEAITGAEWNVMRIIWSLGSASTNKIIENLQAESDWKDSTIKTLLARLVKKGFLTSEKAGRQFVYQAVVPEQTAMNQSAEELFSHLCNMKSGKTLIELVKTTEMSKSDLATLQKVIETKMKTAPDEVDCNCLPSGSCE
ncbi:CopY/TcrY family copper transport repressor [Fructilactobacillus frigidiflavus]|uniref:CopY/TcrY family copper transport repressor n=1 Tax=Fructilactobacillus frigidiflavus TaxID=3242688 RepID=UPI00375745E9